MKIVQTLETVVIVVLLALEVLHDFKLVPFDIGLKVLTLICAAVLLILCIVLAAKKKASWGSICLACMFVIRWICEMIY